MPFQLKNTPTLCHLIYLPNLWERIHLNTSVLWRSQGAFYNNDKCFLVLVICISLFCIFSFFFQKEESNRLKKASCPKFGNIIFLFLVKIGSVGPVDQQMNLVSPSMLLSGLFSGYLNFDMLTIKKIAKNKLISEKPKILHAFKNLSLDIC